MAESNIRRMFKIAKIQSSTLAKKLEESKKITMTRKLQEYAISLMSVKHGLGPKWKKVLCQRLEKEEKNLFGLSQTLTYVGTRAKQQYVKNKLCQLGGQVVLLGKELVPLLEKNLKEHKIDLKPIKAQHS